MILVHSMQGEPIYVNPNMIETMRITPDTVLFLSTNKRIPVKDSPDTIVKRIVEYQRRILEHSRDPQTMIQGDDPDALR